jgi:hypothetical protein
MTTTGIVVATMAFIASAIPILVEELMQKNANQTTPDQLNELGVLKRREIEARILAPLLEALSEAFDRERVLEVTKQTIAHIARQQGAALVEQVGGCTLIHFANSMEAWKKDDAMHMQVLELDDEHYSFNVTRCRYAEMYRELGISELGVLLSCNRDFRLIEGFNPEIRLQRNQTIMEGAPYCDFRFIHTQKGEG